MLFFYVTYLCGVSVVNNFFGKSCANVVAVHYQSKYGGEIEVRTGGCSHAMFIWINLG